MIILIVLIAIFVPHVVHAAYLDQAEVLRYEQEQNGSARLIMRFQGNSGEPIVDRPYHISSGASVAKLRNWISQVVTELNLARLAGTAPQVAPGTTLTGLSPSPVSPTAKGVWRTKTQIYKQACESSFTGSVATDCAALKTDIENTYQSGFLNAD